MRILIAVASLMAVGMPAYSQAAAPASHRAKPTAPPTTKITIEHAPPNFDAMLAIVDKLFPAQPGPDPARLTLLGKLRKGRPPEKRKCGNCCSRQAWCESHRNSFQPQTVMHSRGQSANL